MALQTPGQPGLAPVIALPTAEPTLAAIVAGLKEGDPRAMVALFRRYRDHVNRLVWRMLGADAEHDDVVQQAFLNALKSVHTLRDPARLEPWLVGVTVNTVRRELRRRKLRRFFHVFGETPEPIAETADPHEQLVLRRFYEALGRLSATDQMVLTLRFVDNQTLPEVASACGCSLATAKRRLASAQRALLKLAQRDVILASRIMEPRDEG